MSLKETTEEDSNPREGEGWDARHLLLFVEVL
jgi:hypothetical protein